MKEILIVILNASSAICALMAAYFWWRVSREDIPEHMGLTVDQTNFDWLTKPLANQGNYNRQAAIYAGFAALLQMATILVGMCKT